MHGTGGLLGREDERTRLAEVIGAARNGHGSALVVVGEPGIGKTALLRDAAQLTQLRAVRLDGYESESAMPYAAIERLTGLLRGHLADIPDRQRQTLDIASGAVDGPAPDRFLVGLGVLSLLAAAGTGQALLCTVDDAHLLDPESLAVLAFVARRLGAEHVAVVLAGRDEADLVATLAGVPVLELAGLAPEPAVALLNLSTNEPFSPTAATAIVRATGGNPLALVDLAVDPLLRELTDLGLGPDPVPIGRHLEAHYLRRVMQLPGESQRWLLLAAADSTGNPELLEDAGARLALDPARGDDAEAAGLVRLEPMVRFRHPLVRSAVYSSASLGERRRAHGALAVAAGKLGLVEAEAWHASRAVTGTDAEVAERLVHAADLAARRGGSASRASILARAARLTPAGALHDERQVEAAEAALEAGAADVAGRLLADVRDADLDRVVRGRAILVRSAVALFVADPAGVRAATTEQLRAADAFRGHDTAREQQALLEAFERCLSAERLVDGTTLDSLGRRMARGASGDDPASRILRGIAAMVLESYAAALGPARDAFAALLGLPDEILRRSGTLIASIGAFLWDDVGRAAGLTRARRAAQEMGDLQRLDTLLWVSALAELCGGSVERARGFDDAVREVRKAMGYDGENVVNGAVLSWTGASFELVAAIADGANATGFGGVGSSTTCALAVRDLAARDYGAARERLHPIVVLDPFLQTTPLFLADHAEAATRSGHVEEAKRSARTLAEMAGVNGSAWCRGVAERALALTGDGEVEQHYRASVEALASTGAVVELARSHLVYGEWLRRARRRREAVAQLRLARDHFDRSGAAVFLPRTLAELEAAGVTEDVAAHGDALDLTTQERTVARLAAAGRTNAEIGANLFISPNTVDYHLRKVFQKLGITSRRQLAEHLGGEGR
ncbi:helix-turn-helix transcriptional regulator [Xylanimonas cellulosilytica]|uniref:helix-turn-helix transcriptional regulator n=1 Tax=Xylanimonas cellulosilytica TaxID=186189 RepID=UPI0002DE8822|nr:LuxR family transcriptional regulator [Xylanimonas cellulosilytica]